MGRERNETSIPTLEEYGENITKEAIDGNLDPVIGREKEIEDLIAILARRTKNNPVLIGEPGVGKTAVAEGLAQLITTGKAPRFLDGNVIMALDLGSILAGTKYRGEFEERLKRIVEEAQDDPSVIIVIDEIHTLVGAGAAEGAVDAANILKPALARGKLRCIGATTNDEYRKYIERDPALERRFHPVRVEEPNVGTTIEILRGVRSKFEQHHTLTYQDKALEQSAILSDKYIADRFLPDKALDVLDEAGARVRLENRCLPKVFLGLMKELQDTIVDKEERMRVYDFDAAQSLVDHELEVRTPNRPIASFIFAGPTGVGKTELTKALSDFMFGSEDSMIRLDMSEFMEKHTVSKMIGSPPGYVGYNEGGQLTEDVRLKPYSVILFDEVEKAHPDVFNLLLQILDDGRLTDAKGRVVDFTNTLVIMTTNLGSKIIEQESGIKPQEESKKVFRMTPDALLGWEPYPEPESSKEVFEKTTKLVDDELKNFFRPEFLNRIDEIIVFNHLTRLDIWQICNIMIQQLKDRLKEKKINLIVESSVQGFLTDEGYEPIYGARPLRHAIMKHLEDNLAEQCLSKNLYPNTKIIVRRKTVVGSPHNYKNELEVEVNFDEVDTMDFLDPDEIPNKEERLLVSPDGFSEIDNEDISPRYKMSKRRLARFFGNTKK